MCECCSRVNSMHISVFTVLLPLGLLSSKWQCPPEPTYMASREFTVEYVKSEGLGQSISTWMNILKVFGEKMGCWVLSVTSWGLWVTGKWAEQKSEWFTGRENVLSMQKETWENSKQGCPAIWLCWHWGGTQDMAVSMLKLVSPRQTWMNLSPYSMEG